MAFRSAAFATRKHTSFFNMVYAGHETCSTMIGFHRATWQIMTARGHTLTDWTNNQPIRYPSNIIDEGLMRNGVHDSNSRGVWFYLGFQHPWAASEEKILVELEVVQSTTHKKSKWHYKYCAADSPPGEPNRWTRVRALHVPVCLLTDEFIRELRG